MTWLSDGDLAAVVAATAPKPSAKNGEAAMGGDLAAARCHGALAVAAKTVRRHGPNRPRR